jgi:hypothetical protein
VLKDIPSYGIGTLAAFAVLAVLAFIFIRDITELKREHVRIDRASGQSVALNMLYPYREPKAKMKVA